MIPPAALCECVHLCVFSAQSVIQSGLANCKRKHCYRDRNVERQTAKGLTEPEIAEVKQTDFFSSRVCANSVYSRTIQVIYYVKKQKQKMTCKHGDCSLMERLIAD